MNFIHALYFQHAEELFSSGFIWYFHLALSHNAFFLLFCVVKCIASLSNVPRGAWMLTMAQWGSWRWYLEEAG